MAAAAADPRGGATLSAATSLQMPSNAIHLTRHKKEEWADKDNQAKANWKHRERIFWSDYIIKEVNIWVET